MSLDFSVEFPSDPTLALGSTQPLVKMSTRNISWGRGGRCVRLTPRSRAECHEIWEPKPLGTLWATPGLLRDSFTFNPLWRCGPTRVMASSCLKFIYRRQIVGRSSLYESSAQRRDLYLTTYNTHNRKNIQSPRRNSNPQSQQANGHWDRLHP
jgi:hypothetical protein